MPAIQPKVRNMAVVAFEMQPRFLLCGVCVSECRGSALLASLCTLSAAGSHLVPFCARREQKEKAKLCVRMEGPTTYIRHLDKNIETPFTFDYSFWSHDGFRVAENGENIGESKTYASRESSAAL
jgi:hypothetical protein